MYYCYINLFISLFSAFKTNNLKHVLLKITKNLISFLFRGGTIVQI